MHNIEIFRHEMFGEIRVVINENKEPLFCGKDVAEALGYKNTRDAIAKHVDSEDKTTVAICDTGSNYKTQAAFINESGLYALILSSGLENAKRFKYWVTSDVLPSIRKHGAYMSDEVIQRTLTDPDYLIQLANVLKEEKQKRMQAEAKVAILTHTNKTYTATEVAKEIGMRSAKELNKWLEQQRVQYKVNDTWVPCAKYSNMAWFEIKQEELDSGHIVYHRKITGLGREGIINLYNKRCEA